MKKYSDISVVAGFFGAAVIATGIGAAVYRFHKGIPVEPVAVADFDGDGSNDLIYVDEGYPKDDLKSLVFVPGRIVTRSEDGKYKRHGFVLPIPGSVHRITEDRDVSIFDFNKDGIRDLVLHNRELATDSKLYASTYTVLLGDGKGRFTRSLELSKPAVNK